MGLLMLLGVAAALFNGIAPPVIREAVSAEITSLFFGAICGQLGLLAIWAVLGPQRLLVRWSLTLLVLVALNGMLLAGVAMASNSVDASREFAITFFLLPLIFLAIQLPLWLAKFALGCRIVFYEDKKLGGTNDARQFRLLHLLGATAAVAGVLGLVRWGLVEALNDAGNDAAAAWIPMLTFCLMAAL